ALGLGHALGALAQGDGDILDAGIAQIERMGMALAAIADDDDLLAFNQVQVGVAIVIDTHGFILVGQKPLAGALRCPELLGSIGRPDKPLWPHTSSPTFSFTSRPGRAGWRRFRCARPRPGRAESSG